MSIAAMKQALEALETFSNMLNNGYNVLPGGGANETGNNAITALRAAIAEAEREEEARLEQIMLDVWQDVGDPRLPGIKSRREWVGLTDEQIRNITGITSANSDWNANIVMTWCRAIDAALKERNQ